MSPFKMGLELERGTSTSGINSFLPSYHEHQQNLIRGNSKKKIINENVDEDDGDKSKFYKRSGTMLLGNIKEPASAHRTKAGEVPKDLGMNLLKDMIDDFDEDEDLDFDKSSKEKQKK